MERKYWSKLPPSNVWFFLSFSGIKMNWLCVGKSLVQASSTECQKPSSNKNCILRIFLSQKRSWLFRHVFLRSKDDSNHRNKKNEQVERSEKLFFPLLEVLSDRLFQKLFRFITAPPKILNFLNASKKVAIILPEWLC